MNIINKTNKQFVQKTHEGKKYWVTNLSYDYTDRWSLNPDLTYYDCMTDNIEIDLARSRMYVHGLEKADIKTLLLQKNKETFKAINAPTLWQSIESLFKKKPKQTIAEYELPILKFGEIFSLLIHKEAERVIALPSPPWSLMQNMECRAEIIKPLIQSVDYFIHQNRITVTLIYSVMTETLLSIQEEGQINICPYGNREL